MKYLIIYFVLNNKGWGLLNTNDETITAATVQDIATYISGGWTVRGQSQDESRIFYTLTK